MFYLESDRNLCTKYISVRVIGFYGSVVVYKIILSDNNHITSPHKILLSEYIILISVKYMA